MVVAGNAIETPRLLLLSKESTLAPTGVANRSGQVGQNLMDHLQGQGATLLADPIYPFRGPPTTVGIDAFRDGADRSHRAASRMSIGNDGWGRTEALYDTLATLVDGGAIGGELRAQLHDRITRQFRISSTEMLPKATNTVTLRRQTSMI